MPGKNPTNNYMGSFDFRVQVEGINDAMDGFLKVSAIKSKTENIDFKHGTDRTVRVAPGRTKWEPVILERVYSGLDEFAQWRQRVVDGQVDRRKVSIEFLRPDGTTVRRYDLYNCYPAEWELPEMDAGSSSTAVERIHLAVEKVVQIE